MCLPLTLTKLNLNHNAATHNHKKETPLPQLIPYHIVSLYSTAATV